MAGTDDNHRSNQPAGPPVQIITQRGGGRVKTIAVWQLALHAGFQHQPGPDPKATSGPSGPTMSGALVKNIVAFVVIFRSANEKAAVESTLYRCRALVGRIGEELRRSPSTSLTSCRWQTFAPPLSALLGSSNRKADSRSRIHLLSKGFPKAAPSMIIGASFSRA
jgi:hypothetical protein